MSATQTITVEYVPGTADTYNSQCRIEGYPEKKLSEIAEFAGRFVLDKVAQYLNLNGCPDIYTYQTECPTKTGTIPTATFYEFVARTVHSLVKTRPEQYQVQISEWWETHTRDGPTPSAQMRRCVLAALDLVGCPPKEATKLWREVHAPLKLARAIEKKEAAERRAAKAEKEAREAREIEAYMTEFRQQGRRQICERCTEEEAKSALPRITKNGIRMLCGMCSVVVGLAE